MKTDITNKLHTADLAFTIHCLMNNMRAYAEQYDTHSERAELYYPTVQTHRLGSGKFYLCIHIPATYPGISGNLPDSACSSQYTGAGANFYLKIVASGRFSIYTLVVNLARLQVSY